jgi:O-Antigen ligase
LGRLRAAEVVPLVPAAAIPFLFLHRRYQPLHVSVGAVDVFASDLAAAAVVAGALYAGWRAGWAPLRAARALWIVAAAFLALLVVSCFWTPLDQTKTHLITAAKIGEYALLAPALVLLLRRRADVERFLLVFTAWSVAASAWGLLQFVGAVNEFEGKRPGQREVSFLGIHDFAAFSAAALAIGLAALALGERRRVALVSGAVGTILAASVFALTGVVLAAAAIALRARVPLRRAAAIGGIVVVVAVGVVALRSYDVSGFFSFLGIQKTSAARTEDVQTGSQRTMLAYIGLRIWEDHALLGVGFERSADRYRPYLADAKRRFPNQPALAYPSPEHRWGVQNFWVQLLADVGVVGLALGLATFLAGLALALRASNTVLLSLVAAGWILVAAGTWNGVGIVAGIPLQALTWLGLGLAAVRPE